MLPPRDQALTPQACEPQRPAPPSCQWQAGLGAGGQGEEEDLASSSSRQKGAIVLSWSSGLISQMSKNCGPGKRRTGQGLTGVPANLRWGPDLRGEEGLF